MKELVKRMPITAHNGHKCFRMRLFRVVTIRLSPSGRRGSLHDDPAWRVAPRRSVVSLAGREVDDGDIVRALIGYVRRFAVAGRWPTQCGCLPTATLRAAACSSPGRTSGNYAGPLHDSDPERP